MEIDNIQVGDILQVKSLDWYNENTVEKENEIGVLIDDLFFVKEMTKFCGTFIRISNMITILESRYYRVSILDKYDTEIDRIWIKEFFETPNNKTTMGFIN